LVVNIAHPDLTDRKRELITFATMKTTTVFALLFLASLPLVFAQESDEADAVLQTERDLAMAYQRSGAGVIAQGVMEDYTLTSSTGKVTTRADDIAEAKKNDPKYEIFENYDMEARAHGDAAVVTGKTHTKGISRGKPFNSLFQFTDTFVKDGGRWRLLASHALKLPAKEK
jgi:ketosteroid isomerase-like protein